MFSSWLTTSSLYKLAVHRALFPPPTLRHQNTDATAHDVSATCNHPRLGTQSIPSSLDPFLCAEVGLACEINGPYGYVIYPVVQSDASYSTGHLVT